MIERLNKNIIYLGGVAGGGGDSSGVEALLGDVTERTNENVILQSDTVNGALNKIDGEFGEALISPAYQDFVPVAAVYTLTEDQNCTTPYTITTTAVINNVAYFEVVTDDNLDNAVKVAGFTNYFNYVKVTAYNPANGEVTLNGTPNANFRIIYKYPYPKYLLPEGKIFSVGVSQAVINAESSNEAKEIEIDPIDNLTGVNDVQTALDEINYNNELYAFTGIISGGELSINTDPTKFNMEGWAGAFVNNYTDPTGPLSQKVSYSNEEAVVVTNLATANVTYLGLASNGDIVQSVTPISSQDQRDIIVLGYIVHESRTQIDGIHNATRWVRDSMLSFFDFMNIMGPVTRSGNVFSANGANLKINKTAGETYNNGRNYAVNKKQVNIVNDPILTAPIIKRGYRDGSGGSTFAVSTDLDPTKYDDGSGTLQTVDAGKYTIQRCFFSSGCNNIVIQYGQNVYNTIEAARSAYMTEKFVKLPELEFVSFRSWLIIEQSTTDLSDTVNEFIPAGKLGDIGLSAGAGSAIGSLQVAYDNRTQAKHIIANTINNALSVQAAGSYTGNLYEGYTETGDLDFSVDKDGKLSSIAIQLDTTAVPTYSEGLIHWNNKEYTANIDTGLGGVSIQVGQETLILYYNDTGVDIPNFKVLHLKGATTYNGELVPTPELADASKWEKTQGTLAVATQLIPAGELGFAVIRGKARGGNTSAWTAGSQLWLSADGSGDLTTTKPQFPDYAISMGGSFNQAAAPNGEILVTITKGVYDTFNDAWDGCVRESFNFLVTSDGTTITGTLSNSYNPAENLTLVLSDGFYTLDTTTAPLTLTLTAGTATNPQSNYVYIDKATKAIQTSTTGFPTTEHCKIATLALFDAAATQADGAIRNQNINDHIKAVDGNGHILHIAERVRQLNASWDDGAAGSLSGMPNNLYFTTTSGHVWQMHKQTFPIQDMVAGGNIHVVNDPTTPYRLTTNLNDLTVDSDGDSLNNKWFGLVLWGVANKTGEQSHIMLNLPNKTYGKEVDVMKDKDGALDFTIPKEFKGVGFLIGKYAVKKTGGTFEHNPSTGYQDLRGFVPNNTAGSGAGNSGVTEFTQLDDVPASYIGQAHNLLQVNTGESALEFVDINTGGTLSNVAYLDQANIFTDQIIANTEIVLNSATAKITGGGGVLSQVTIESSSSAGGTQPILFRTKGADAANLTADGDFDVLRGSINIPTGEDYKINNTSINTGGTLPNVSYLDQDNVYTSPFHTVSSGTTAMYRIFNNDASQVCCLLAYLINSGGTLKLKNQAGSEQVRISSYEDSYILQDLGVGEATPEAKLHVKTASAGAVRGLLIEASISTNATPMEVRGIASGSTLFKIDDNGKTFINAGYTGVAPIGILNATATNENIFNIYNNDIAGVGKQATIRFNANRTTAGRTEIAAISAEITDIGSAVHTGDLLFFTDGTSGLTEGMRLTSDNQLQVIGFVKAGGVQSVNSSTGYNATFTNNSSTGQGVKILAGSSSGTGRELLRLNDGGDVEKHLFTDEGNYKAAGDIYANTSKIVATQEWVSDQSAYGSMYENGTGSTIAITTAGTYYGWTTAVDGGSNNCTFTGNGTADRITFNTAGIFRVDGTVSFSGSSNSTVVGTIFKNGVATNIEFTRKLGTGGDTGTASLGSLPLSIAVNDYIDLRFTADDNGDAISIKNAQIMASKI